MGVNVPELIVHVEEAPEAIFSRGHWPVTRQDILVELKVLRGLCKVQQPRPFVKHHHDFLQLMPSHLVDSPGSSPFTIPEAALRTLRHSHDHNKPEILLLEIHHWTGVIPSKQPVELAKWHAFKTANQQRALIPKPG